MGIDVFEQARLKKEKGESTGTSYLQSFNKSKELWSQKIERNRLPKKLKKVKVDGIDEEKLIALDKQAVTYRQRVAEIKSVKKKAAQATTTMGRGRNRDEPVVKPDLATRKKREEDARRARRLGLESAEKKKEKERARQREARFNRGRNYTSAPVTAVGMALAQHSEQSQISQKKKAQKLLNKKAKMMAISGGSGKRMKTMEVLQEEQAKNDVEDKAMKVTPSMKKKMKESYEADKQQIRKKKSEARRKRKQKKQTIDAPSGYFTKILHILGTWILWILSVFTGGGISTAHVTKAKTKTKLAVKAAKAAKAKKESKKSKEKTKTKEKKGKKKKAKKVSSSSSSDSDSSASDE